MESTSITKFVSLNAFYDANPERRHSGEADYGVHWTENGLRWPNWRVSYVRATGEVYAICTGGPNLGQVRILGVVPTDSPSPKGTYYSTLDTLLKGWADAPRDLSWIVDRLSEAAKPTLRRFHGGYETETLE